MVSRPFVQPSQNPIALKEYSDYFNVIAETEVTSSPKS